eukprot:11159710-Lingulodinium_polyedra.AAC.1
MLAEAQEAARLRLGRSYGLPSALNHWPKARAAGPRQGWAVSPPRAPPRRRPRARPPPGSPLSLAGDS